LDNQPTAEKVTRLPVIANMLTQSSFRHSLCALLALTLLASQPAAAQDASVALADGDVKVGTILANEVEEYHIDINGAEFRAAPFDMHIILDVIAGDCDLVVKGPNRFMDYSEHPSGADVLYVSRQSIMDSCKETEMCRFRVLVVGYSETADWEMTFDTETEVRSLHTKDQAVMEAIYNKCCTGPGSCLKWEKGVSASGVGDTSNFCHLPSQICNSNGRITHLDLSDSALQCDLPHELAELTTLERLYLEDNSITGTFTAFVNLVKGMRNLKHIHISDNKLSGELTCCPADASNCLHHLKTLELKRNNIAGDLPECLLQLPELGVLNLRDNMLTGSFPSSLPSNPHIVVLDVRSQRSDGMHGPLPDFTPFSKLALLGLSNNRFSGAFPAIPKRLEAIHLSDNQVEGPFHSTVAELENMWIFEASGNAITGAIPAGLAKSKTIKLLNVANNQMDEPLPTLWESENLRILEINGNRIPGPVPASLASLSRMVILNLSDNALTGDLNGFAGMLGFNQLRQFSMNQNLLTGAIPSELSRLQAFSLFPSFDSSSTQVFDVSFNNLNGEWPDFLMASLLQLSSSDMYDFDFTVQGNDIQCPSADVKDIITDKLPEVAASTCKDISTGSLRTVSGGAVPEEVILRMEEVRSRATRNDWEGNEGSSGADYMVNPGAAGNNLPTVGARSTALSAPEEPMDAEASSAKANLPVIIGVGVAIGVVAIVALVLLGMFVIRPMVAKRRAEKYQEYNGDEGANHTAPVMQGKQMSSDAEAPVPTMNDIEMS